MKTPVGLDFGNSEIKIVIDDKRAKIPAIYSAIKPDPQISNKTGMELKLNAFRLIFNDVGLWFGPDVLTTGAVSKVDALKYDPAHISILFRAALYAWQRQHKTPIADLGRLHIVASMPPGAYQNRKLNSQAITAYRKAFNRGQSHVKIRDGRESIQIVTHFEKLVREAVVWGEQAPRKNETILVLDLGGGTSDLAIFNGSTSPIYMKTFKAGLLKVYHDISSINPASAELKILRNKSSLPGQVINHYDWIMQKVQIVNNTLRSPVDKIYVIGGGAALMPNSIKAEFKKLAGSVIIKDEYANAQANHKVAVKLCKSDSA